ncbi:polysaccharide deacetylase family protein [Micromonospora foliorum]|uniref:polysaccharide deacetylase family protein n=1 Tax=Micromonospora foliorum TaxID=2911210 RepID=UPI001EE92E30|nr:polysaccharide deacetylase family protein [Micromonospora foliorum]MCG5436439.1 polysaccharide deacetylase family protein [Micromonospora foliorum]
MRSVTTARATSIVLLVVAALLGGAYLIGRELFTDRHLSPAPHHLTVAGAHDPDVRPKPSAEPSRAPERAHGQVRLSSEEGGPSGARMTTGSAQVALTFDDGPDPTWTPLILDVLRRAQVKATFCLVGENAEAYPDLVRAIVAEGHTVCNHTWNHDLDLGTRPRQDIEADLQRTSNAIHAAAAQTSIQYFRQPGGAWTDQVVAVADELGMTSLHWAVDPRDWEVPGAASIAATVIQGVEAGSIVLMHDGGGDRQGSVTALDAILPDLMRRFAFEALPVGRT